MNGTIVHTDFNARHNAYEYELTDADEFVPTKKYVTKDSSGKWYGMSNVPNVVEWNEQAEKIEVKLLADQALSLNDDGEVDGVLQFMVMHL